MKSNESGLIDDREFNNALTRRDYRCFNPKGAVFDASKTLGSQNRVVDRDGRSEARSMSFGVNSLAAASMNQERCEGVGPSIRRTVIGSVMLASTIVGAAAEDQISGVKEFQTYCAVCHGLEGHGDGPLAAKLTSAPTDLTTLSEANGGSFPETVVYQIIDGRRVILFHGTREMPVWGDRFMAESGASVADERVSALVKYVEGIQAK